MNASLFAMCLLSAAPLEVGTLLQYEGQIVADREEEGSRKQVQYQLLVAETGEKQLRLLWSVAEKGQGGWPWVEQFGGLESDARGKVIDGRPASVLYEHADGLSPVPLIPPLLAGPKPLADGVAWRAARLQHEVHSLQDKAQADKSWRIEVSTAIGRRRNVLVDKQTSLVTDVDETVFMGPGKKHRLTLALIEQKQLDEQALKQAVAAFDALAALREKLEYKSQAGRVQWSDAQLAMLKEQMPAVLELAKGTPWEDLALRGGGDARLQKGIAAAIDKLRKQHVGAMSPKLDLPSASLSGTPLNSGDLKGQVVVLHLWDYRDNPLVEPYGQVGYLDFLHRRHKADGVQVFGIAVDARLDQPQRRSDAIRSVRKLSSFMNLGYPIVLGGRRVLEQFGDPTSFGAELPLVVIIGGDGKIAHYHVGLYDIDRDRGLAVLDAAVEKLK